ncbi:Ovarian cancer-associated protein 2 [Dissophora globulifera]|uniref:Ovarian cancer-associated protein 2 n=1 Tax=Dissophora globulifera TaxID=979702 RepID=A0A9P6USW7_9FUNG|nr:Ovarian cancer-associated protein 2 [Dissophora globulifera]
MTLRILCLHGYTQNAQVFTKKTAVFRKALKGVADLAPHVLPIPTLETPEEREADQLNNLEPESIPYGWWTSSPERPQYKGLDESLTGLRDVLEKQGPFDGVMGFSQGASMASLLQLLLERPHLSHVMTGCRHGPLKFAIVVSGFEPRDSALMAWYTNKYPLLEPRRSMDSNDMDVDDNEDKENVEPKYIHGVQGSSMHVIGRTDVIIEAERSEGLMNHYKFKTPVTLYHDGGHYLPSNAASRQAYKSFVESFI